MQILAEAVSRKQYLHKCETGYTRFDEKVSRLEGLFF